MKTLRKEFKSCGFYFEQVEREGNVAIYKKTSIKPPDSRPGYEIIRIASHNGYNLGGAYIDPAETYPSNSMWGTSGFTAMTLAGAHEKFKQMQGYPDRTSVVKVVIKKKPTSGSVQPHLTCIVSGACRPTTVKYLQGKADKLNTTIEAVQKSYISKSAMSLLVAGHTVDTVREMLGASVTSKISDEQLSCAMTLNGRKQRQLVKV